MARKAAGMVKTQEGATNLELTAKAGESLLVKGIYIDTPDEDYLTVTCARSTVGFFRVGGTQGNMLFFPVDADHRMNLLDYLIAEGIHTGYPVPEGETFSLSGANGATSTQVVKYDIHDAGDFTAESPNGPLSAAYTYLSIGVVDGGADDGDNLYDEAVTPVEFPNFPFGDSTPMGKALTMYGIAFSEYAETSGTAANKQNTEAIKLVRERTVLYDEDKKGLPCLATAPASDGTSVASGLSVFGALTDLDMRLPYMLPEPIDFAPNEELNVYVNTEETDGTAMFAETDCEIAFIISVR